MADWFGALAARAESALAWLGTRGVGPDLDEILSGDRRIIEVGSRQFAMSEMLCQRGCQRVLAVTLEDAAGFESVRARHPRLRDRLVRSEHPRQIAENNAEILILSEPRIRSLWSMRRHRQAEYVLWAPTGARAWRDTLGFLRDVRFGRARHRLELLGVRLCTDLTPGPRLVWITRNLTRKPASPRRHLPPRLGVDGFLRALDEQGCRYAVLRWFDALPALPPGEDLDLLVADADVPKVEELLGAGPGLQPVDLYSESGLPGTAYKRMAYYPPELARGLLERAVPQRSSYRVPCSRDHFLSLAYHALYHKGARSGLPSDSPDLELEASPDHDYVGTLSALARELGEEVPIRLEALDDYLAIRGWRPPLDTRTKLAGGNPWLAGRIAGQVAERSLAEPPGLSVFFVRERALELGLVEEIAKGIEESGFEILMRRRLSKEARVRVARQVRGGNWGRGPYACSAGGPAFVLAAYDAAPIPPSPAQRKQHPGLDDARVLVKSRLRESLNARLPESERCNFVHSSDNAWGAREYLDLALPEAVDELLRSVEERRAIGGASSSGPAARQA